MNDILEFLESEEEKIFLEYGLEKIIEVLKEYFIYKYKVIYNKLIFKFCDYEYLIINNDDKYKVEFGHKISLPKSLEEFVEWLPDILKYGRMLVNGKEKKYPEPIEISASYEITGIDLAEGCPGTEWKSDPAPVINCPYISVIHTYTHNDKK